ncbi:hypothetical protein, partial [Nocardia cyriacigeorgica]|uniref:hypothetical protein n=1 Tax=Nocardia cyriacigeorgica TaxID=135487 RepID=UPI002453F3C5
MYGITETTVHVSFLSVDEQLVDNPASVIGPARARRGAGGHPDPHAPGPRGGAGPVPRHRS